MNKLFNSTPILWLFILPLLFSACRPEVDPDNVITDPSGLRLDIMWFNDAGDPTVNTSISAIVDVNSYSYHGTGNYHSFGYTELVGLKDGSYDIKVKIDLIDRPTHYVISLTGRETGRNIWQEFGPVDVKDLNKALIPAKLEVSGYRYTIQLN